MLTLSEIEPLVDDQPDEALRHLTQILDKDPNDAGALYMIGNVILRQEKDGLAYNILQRCCELAPHRAEAWNSLGQAIVDLDPELAQEYWDRSISLDPKLTYPYANKALIHLNRCEPDKAIKLPPGS